MLSLEKQPVWRGSSCCYILSFLYYRYVVWTQSMVVPIATHVGPFRICGRSFVHKLHLIGQISFVCCIDALNPWYSMFAGFWGVCWSFASSDSFARACLWMAGKHYSTVITIGSWMSDRIILSTCPGSNLLLFGIYCLAQYLKKYKKIQGGYGVIGQTVLSTWTEFCPMFLNFARL
jgi:hypothetical protein